MRRGDVVRLKPEPEDPIWEWDSWLVRKYGMGPFLYRGRAPNKQCFLETMEGDAILSEFNEWAPFELCDLIHDPFMSAVRKRRRHAKAKTR